MITDMGEIRGNKSLISSSLGSNPDYSTWASYLSTAHSLKLLVRVIRTLKRQGVQNQR